MASDIKEQLKTLCSKEVFSRIEVTTLDSWVYRFLKEHGESKKVAYLSDQKIKERWINALGDSVEKYNWKFLRDEWREIIQANRILELEEYLRVSRIGRGTSINRKERCALWKIFKRYSEELEDDNLLEPEEAYHVACKIIEIQSPKQRYCSFLLDEAQDFSAPAFRLLSRLAGNLDANNLFIVGDGHQRIYNRRIVLSRLGIKVQGRSRKLRVNYRTSDEIRRWANALLQGENINDLDANLDRQSGERSLYHGPKPQVNFTTSADKELETVLTWIHQRQAEGFASMDLCIIARDNDQEWVRALQSRGVDCITLTPGKADNRQIQGVRVATMHRVKGLEFSGVALVGVSQDKVPNGRALDSCGDAASREEALQREKLLLHVSATRAKRWLLVTSSGKPSPFLEKSIFKALQCTLND